MTIAMHDQSDRQLLACLQQNRAPDAFAELVRRHHGMLYGVAKRMTGCPHAAEDVVQATFLVLAKDATKIRKQTALASWLYGIAFRISARFVKQRSKTKPLSPESEVMPASDPLERLSEQFERNTVFEELYALPEKNRAAMVLRYLQGKSNAEVAKELSLSEAAIEGRLKRGRNQLRLRLARQGVAFAVGVSLLSSIKKEAAATETGRLVADTVAVCTAGGASTGNELIKTETIRLAEEEMMKMFTTKVWHGVAVTLATLCIAAAGWGLGGTAIALAQGEDPFGEFEDAHADPFGDFSVEGEAVADPFGPAPTPVTSNPFATESTPPAQQESGFGNPISKNATLIERMQKLGYYGIGNETDSEVRILEAIANDAADFEFADEPLQNVAAMISERHNIQIVFDKPALEEEMIDPSSDSVSLELKKVKLQSALNLLLDQLHLAAVVRDEVLMITTKVAAEGMLTTRLYKIPEHWQVKEEVLLETITNFTKPDSWDSVGGPGTAKSVPGALFVSNTQDVHTAICKIFAQLEQLYEQP